MKTKRYMREIDSVNAVVFAGIVGLIITLITLIVLAYYAPEPDNKARTTTRTINGTYSNGTIVTTDNNVWKVTNYNGISTKGNHKVTVKFDTKGTDSVLDDEIVKITEIR